MEECCKYEPIIVNGKYVGGNIVYCSKHAAAPELYEALASIENDNGTIPEAIWNMRNSALAKARGES